MKRFFIIFLISEISLLSYTGADYLKMAIKAYQNGLYSLSIRQIEKFFKNPEKQYIDYAYLLYSASLIKLNRLDEAEEKLINLMEKYPDSKYLKESFEYLFYIYIKKGKIEKLLNLYKDYSKKFGRNIDIESDISQIIAKKGISLFNSGNINRSKKLFKILITRFPDSKFSPFGYYYLGLIFYNENRFGKAKYYFEKSLPSISDKKILYDIYLKLGDCCLNIGDIENAKKFYDIVLKNSKIEELKLWALFQKATILKKEKNYKECEEYLEKIIQEAKDEKLKNYALFEISRLNILQEKWDDAENFLVKIIENKFEPLLPDVILQLGFIYFNKGEFDKSINYFKDYISKYKDDNVFSAYFGLGYCYYKKGNFEKAESIWKKVFERKPESKFSSHILFILGKHNYENKKFKDAEKYFKKLLKYFPESPLSSISKPLYIRALIYQKKYKDAKKLCEKFLKNGDDEIKLLYGESLYYLKEYKKAEKFLLNVSKRIPSLKAESLYFLSNLYLKKNDVVKAKEKLLEIITFYPNIKEWEELAEKRLKELPK